MQLPNWHGILCMHNAGGLLHTQNPHLFTTQPLNYNESMVTTQLGHEQRLTNMLIIDRHHYQSYFTVDAEENKPQKTNGESTQVRFYEDSKYTKGHSHNHLPAVGYCGLKLRAPPPVFRTTGAI